MSIDERLCSDCNERPRKPLSSYCRECQNARNLLSYHARKGEVAPLGDIGGKKTLCKDCVDEKVDEPNLRLPNTSYCHHHRNKRNRDRARKQREEAKATMERMILAEKEHTRLHLERIDEEQRWGSPPEDFGLGPAPSAARALVDKREAERMEEALKNFKADPDSVL